MIYLVFRIEIIKSQIGTISSSLILSLTLAWPSIVRAERYNS